MVRNKKTVFEIQQLNLIDDDDDRCIQNINARIFGYFFPSSHTFGHKCPSLSLNIQHIYILGFLFSVCLLKHGKIVFYSVFVFLDFWIVDYHQKKQANKKN